jgi:hypothetical protein
MISEMPRLGFWRMAAWAAIAIAAACSSFDSAGGDAPADAGTDAPMSDDGPTPPPAPGDDGGPDAGKDATCAIGATFVSMKQLVGVNSPYYDTSPRLSHDERVIYFRLAKPGGAGVNGTLMRAERAAVGAPFAAPIEVPTVPPSFANPYVAPGELVLYFNDQGLAYRATSAAPGGPFGGALQYFVDGSSPNATIFTEDQKEIFYSLAGAGVGVDLWSAIETDAGFANAAAISTLNSVNNEDEPAISADGLELFFYSDRGRTGNTGIIYQSSRATRSAPWVTPKKVAELEPDSSASFASPGAISPDHCRLYYYAPADSAGWDIYIAERAPTP